MSHKRGYRRKDEHQLVSRLPNNREICQKCGRIRGQVKHHVIRKKVIYIWSVCRHCNQILKQHICKAVPIYTIYGFYDWSCCCMTCGRPSRLVKHHFFENETIVHVLRVCSKCNSRLPTIGLIENNETINRLEHSNINNDTDKAKAMLLGLLYNNYPISQERVSRECLDDVGKIIYVKQAAKITFDDFSKRFT